MSNAVAGVDGCKGGWLVALWAAPRLELHLIPSFIEVLDLTRDCLRVAVDMPIGLPRVGEKRLCDQMARQLLGARRSSVFPAPPRAALGATHYDQVRGYGMSLQSYHLLPKIRELDGCLNPALQARCYEAHPELVWRRWHGRPLEFSKKTPEGQKLRRELCPLPVPRRCWPTRLVQDDDVLDALALAGSAQEHLQGLGLRLPSPSPACDERGLRMEIYG